MVGKTTFIKDAESYGYISGDNLTEYFLTREKEYGLDYSSSWSLCAAIMTAIKLAPTQFQNYIMDRGILSTMMYDYDKTEVKNFIHDKYIKLCLDCNAEVLVLAHKDIESARIKYNSREARNNDPHSDFNTFEEYWKKYQEYMSRSRFFEKMLSGYGIKVKRIYLEAK